jgi:hypothetical protein
MMWSQPMKQIVLEDDFDPGASFEIAPRKVALVAADADATFGYAPFFAAVAEAADAAGCDSVVYALAPRPGIPVVSYSQLFGKSRGVRSVVLEVTEPSGNAVVEVWRQGVRTPHRFRQRLVRSQDSDWNKRLLMRGLACGEANIISTQRDSSATVDRFGFLSRLSGQRLVLNPSHTYMVRPEMKEKRRRFSENGRVVLAVWNPGHQIREASVPWQAFVDGREATELIAPIDFVQPLVQVGVFDLGEA